jgi:hypothetical protein
MCTQADRGAEIDGDGSPNGDLEGAEDHDERRSSQTARVGREARRSDCGVPSQTYSSGRQPASSP